MNIYLAGGMHSDWRNIIINSSPVGYKFFNPMSHGLKDENQYTEWDLDGIKKSNIIVVYMDDENPSGYGLNLEVGYAKALGKLIIFIDNLTDNRRKHFGMVRACSNIIVKDIKECIILLYEFIKLDEVL